MTKRGIEKFRVIVKNRPDVVKREGNVFYFNWPKRQLEDYFRRFGYDAVIVSPEECRNSMKAFYRRSFDTYNRNHL